MKKVRIRSVKRKKATKSARRKSNPVKKTTAITKEERSVSNRIMRVAINARRRAYNNNASVTIIREGKIVRINPAGKEEVIGRVRRNLLNVDVHKPVRIK